jgi:hypothetical protein
MSPELQGVYAAAVTAHNSTNITGAGDRGFLIYVGVGGDVSVETIGGQTPIVFKNMASGTILPVRVVRVNSTNTTATNMVAIN